MASKRSIKNSNSKNRDNKKNDRVIAETFEEDDIKKIRMFKSQHSISKHMIGLLRYSVK